MKLSAVFLALLIALVPGKARAVSAGDAALTVAIGTVSGAILGASTLPFYSQPSDHTKSIFYGAAIGAVVGVFVAAYAGVEEGKVDEDENASLKQLKILANAKGPNQPNAMRPLLFQEKTNSTNNAVLAYYPVKLLQF